MAISADVRLYCYNEALRSLSLRQLAVGEVNESSRVLDGAWGANNEGINQCLSKANWNFASRSVKLEPDPGLETSFGFRDVYRKADDFERLVVMASDEYFLNPLTAQEYSDEGGFWYSNIQPLYAKFVSNRDDLGFNSGLWPVPFKKFVAAYLAEEVCQRLTGSTSLLGAVRVISREMESHAESRDAMDEGVKIPPPSSWASSRMGGYRGRDNKITFGS